MHAIATYTQRFDTEREYVSNFGAEGGLAELARVVDLTIERLLPDVPGTSDDNVRALLEKRLAADVLNSQWVTADVGPELHWRVGVRGSASSARAATIELLRQHAVGMSECSFELQGVPVVGSVRAVVAVEAVCCSLGYAAARAGKARPPAGRARARAGEDTEAKALAAWTRENEAYRKNVIASGSVLDPNGARWPAPPSPTEGARVSAPEAGRARGFAVTWTAVIRIALGPFTVATRALLRDLLYTVRTE